MNFQPAMENGDKSRYGVDLEAILTGFPYQTQNSFCEFTPPYIREPS